MLKLNSDKTVSYGKEVIGASESLSNFGQGFNIQLADGSFVFISEEDCTANEKEVFDAYHEIYKETGGIPPQVENAPDLDVLKSSKIAQSKSMLSDYLAETPLLWTDGKYYSVTAEKQNLLRYTIGTYKDSVSSGKPVELKWNTTGDESTVWTIENLTALSLAIYEYVTPLAEHQRALEKQINTCSTVDELENIVIDFNK